jgi:hypothetical protein
VANDAVRRTANLTGWINAVLSFAIDGTIIDATDDISVEISPNGAAPWTELERFNGDPGLVTRSYDVTPYIGSNTTVRFIMRDPLETGTGDGDYWQIDDVDFLRGDTAGAGDILVTGSQLRFAETADVADLIQREVNLPVNGGLTATGFARLKYSLGYSGVELDGSDEFRVDVSANGGGAWTTLATFGSAAGNPPTNPSSQTFDIGAYAAANTRVRFYQVDALEAGEYWYVDDVKVEWG